MIRPAARGIFHLFTLAAPGDVWRFRLVVGVLPIMELNQTWIGFPNKLAAQACCQQVA